jgi:protein-S-isoprenylcysteine O-methyltransferase Ste14
VFVFNICLTRRFTLNEVEGQDIFRLRIINNGGLVFLIIFALAIWGLVHSFLASHAAKDFARRSFGAGFMRLYRLAYNIFSVTSFLPVLWLVAALPDQNLYSVPSPWKYLMIFGQGLAALCLLIAVFQTDLFYFVGLRQLLFAEDKPGSLVTDGFYKLVRHPIYTFSLFFLWLNPNMTVNSLTFYVGATLYFLIGAYFEERKLLREFGSVYAEYKAVTPMLIPGLVLS